MGGAGRQRLVTGLLASALVLAAIFALPPIGFFLVALVTIGWAGWEYTAIVRKWAPSAPLYLLLPLIALSSVGLLWLLHRSPAAQGSLPLALISAGVALILTLTFGILLSRVEMADAMVGVGLLAFGVPYFSLPPVSLYLIQKSDPWLALLLLAIVVFGDTFAYYVGSKIGRHKMAPVISPNKSWEGSIAGFLSALAVALVWSLVRLGEVRWELLVLAAVTAVVAQSGDLLESMVKRGAGVKDSSQVLPGHGGFYDRLDALLLAAPTFMLGAWLLGWIR